MLDSSWTKYTYLSNTFFLIWAIAVTYINTSIFWHLFWIHKCQSILGNYKTWFCLLQNKTNFFKELKIWGKSFIIFKTRPAFKYVSKTKETSGLVLFPHKSLGYFLLPEIRNHFFLITFMSLFIEWSMSRSVTGVPLIQQKEGKEPPCDTSIPMPQTVFISSAHNSSSLGEGQTIKVEDYSLTMTLLFLIVNEILFQIAE